MTPKKDSNTDILVAIATLETKLDILSEDVSEIKNGTKADIEFLKTDKISRNEMVRINTDQTTLNVDFESRLRFIEKYMWGAIAVVSAAVFALNYFHPFVK